MDLPDNSPSSSASSSSKTAMQNNTNSNKSDTNHQDQRSSVEQASSSSSAASSSLTNRPSTSKLEAKRNSKTLSKNLKNFQEGPSHAELEKRDKSGKRNETNLLTSGTETDDNSGEVQLISFNNARDVDWEEPSNSTSDDDSRVSSPDHLPTASITSQLSNLQNSTPSCAESQPINQSNNHSAECTAQCNNNKASNGEGSMTASSSCSSRCVRNHSCREVQLCKILPNIMPIACYLQANENLMSKPIRQRNSLDFGMSAVQATTIISNHSHTDITRNVTNAAQHAITTLTSSSLCQPVTTLTVMESPKLSTFSINNKVYNWQTLMPTIKHRMATIFNSEILADVYFLVGRKSVRFPAHKFVLSIGSAVFDAMFNGPLTKANQKTTNESSEVSEIEIPDVEPEAFRALLRFLYMDEVDIGPETVMATLYSAKKYEVATLEMACVDFLKENLTSENAFMLLTQARLFDETALADMCLETIDKHTLDTLCSEAFLEIDLDTLKLVLSRDTLRSREVSLFAAVVRWSEVECQRKLWQPNADNKRKVLGDALFLIRFPLMTIEEFAVNVAQSGLLTDKEMVNLFIYYTVSSKPSVPFSIEPRCCITGEECAVNRFQRTECRWGYSGTSDRIRFLTDRPIFVIGFGLFGSIHGPSEYNVCIEIIHTGSGNVLAKNTTSFLSDGSDSIFRVMFQHPVEIAQNTNYTACATLKGLDSYYGSNGCRTVTVNIGKGGNKENVTFQFSYAAGCNNGTSVEDGQIPQILFYT